MLTFRQWEQAGMVKSLKVCGMTVYCRMGSVVLWSLFGWVYFKRAGRYRCLLGIRWSVEHAA